MLMLGTAILLKVCNDTTVFTIMIRCFNKLLKRYYESRAGSKTCRQRLWTFIIYLFIIFQIIDQTMLVALRLCLLPILKPYLNREKVNLVFSFEYNIIDPVEKFLLILSFLLLIRYQSEKKLQNQRVYNQMFSSKQLSKRVVTFKSGIIQQDGHFTSDFTENGRHEKK